MSVVGTRKTMPILQNVLIEAKEGSRMVNNYEFRPRSKCSIKAEVSEEGTITLPVKELGRIIRELADMEVGVETSETPKATISTRGSIFNVIGMDSKEFPHCQNWKRRRSFPSTAKN